MKNNTNGPIIQTDFSSRSIQTKAKEKDNPIKNGNKLNLETKILIIILIVVIIILVAAIIIVSMLYLKSKQKYEREISDVETEKRVLENQKIKLNAKIKNLTDFNDSLNFTNVILNDKLNKVSNEEIKRNKTYEILSDLTKEGESLKAIFSAITRGIETMDLRNEVTSVESSSRRLEDNLNTLKDQLELIKSLMEQISLNLDLANQNKELVL